VQLSTVLSDSTYANWRIMVKTIVFINQYINYKSKINQMWRQSQEQNAQKIPMCGEDLYRPSINFLWLFNSLIDHGYLSFALTTKIDSYSQGYKINKVFIYAWNYTSMQKYSKTRRVSFLLINRSFNIYRISDVCH